jgi:hypothetical protein
MAEHVARFVHRRRDCDAAMGETPGLLHFVIDVNHFRSKAKVINGIRVCLNFHQMSQIQGIPTMPVCSPQVFNTVIHRFRGHPESVCDLN